MKTLSAGLQVLVLACVTRLTQSTNSAMRPTKLTAIRADGINGVAGGEVLVNRQTFLSPAFFLRY